MYEWFISEWYPGRLCLWALNTHYFVGYICVTEVSLNTQPSISNSLCLQKEVVEHENMLKSITTGSFNVTLEQYSSKLFGVDGPRFESRLGMANKINTMLFVYLASYIANSKY